MNEFEAWVGREARQEDRLDSSLARRWCATFNRLEPTGPMPQGIHFCLCSPAEPTANLGDDGHPARLDGSGSFLPPVPLPRRMWAGSSLVFHRPIMIDAAIARTSRIASIVQKDGASGGLVFVEVDHETTAAGVLAVTERQTLVFRPAAAPDAPLSPPAQGDGVFDPSAWDAHRELTPDPRLLFRYSALTFNSHRIHYDLAYAREVERYRGLVVHGPLTASLLLQLADQQFGTNRLARFSFRGESPAIAGEPLHLVMRGAGDGIEMGAFAADGRRVTKAEGVLA